jgi:dienelactone hydrolase
MHATAVDYDADGMRMVGRLAVPDGDDPRPAVLIAHEGPGLDDIQLARADRLAELGFVAFALDYHGAGRYFTDRAEMMTRLGELGADPERTAEIATPALDVLLSEPAQTPREWRRSATASAARSRSSSVAVALTSRRSSGCTPASQRRGRPRRRHPGLRRHLHRLRRSLRSP